jgi:peptidylamidoglycolate lyase
MSQTGSRARDMRKPTGYAERHVKESPLNKQRVLGAVVLALMSLATSAANVAGTSKAGSEQAGEYNVVHGWPILPDGEVLGAVSGVGVDSHGRVFVFHRSGRATSGLGELDLTPIMRPTVTVFDGHSGVVVARWGAGLFSMPHGLSIDAHDNVWLTDLGLQQVYKFSPDGHVLLTLGERGVAGNDAGHFNRPTAVAVSADGSFYVSDGYRNTRVLKFAADGHFLFQWGTKGSGPGQFDLPHGVALDATGNVYVADRGNARVQIFDSAGHFSRQWADKQLGRPYAVALDRRGNTYVVDGGDSADAQPGRSAWAVVRADGRPFAKIGRFGNYDGQFEIAHSIAVDAEGSVYVGDVTGGRVQKFVRRSR